MAMSEEDCNGGKRITSPYDGLFEEFISKHYNGRGGDVLNSTEQQQDRLVSLVGRDHVDAYHLEDANGSPSKGRITNAEMLMSDRYNDHKFNN